MFNCFKRYRRGGVISEPIVREHDIPAVLLPGEVQLLPAEDVRPGDLVYISQADGKVYKYRAGCDPQPRCFRIPADAVIEGGLLNIPSTNWPPRWV